MNDTFENVQDAFMALSNPEDPRWAAAFRFLAAHPETAQMMLETFQETLREMGAEASGEDPVTGEPVYSLTDVARALGITEGGLGSAVGDSTVATDTTDPK